MEKKYKRILIAIDNSAYSMKAAKTGFSLAHQLGASIGLLYVVNKSKEVVNADLGITPEQSKMVLLNEAEKTNGKTYTTLHGLLLKQLVIS